MLGRMANFDVLGDGMHSPDAPHVAVIAAIFSRVAADVPGQADDVLVNSNADMRGIQAGVKFQFIDDILPEFKSHHVSLHDRSAHE